MSIANKFIAFIQSICAKGYVTDDERIIAHDSGRVVGLNSSQVDNVLEINLHRGYDQDREEATAQGWDEGTLAPTPDLPQEPGDGESVEEARSYTQLFRELDEKEQVLVDHVWKQQFSGLEMKPSILAYFQGYYGLPDRPSIERILEDFIDQADVAELLNQVRGLGTTKINLILGAFQKVCEVIEGLVSCTDSQDRMFLMLTRLFSLDVQSEGVWLRAYLARYSAMPYFWLFRRYILSNSKERRGQITINLLSESQPSISDMAELFDVTRSGISQILDEILEDEAGMLIEPFQALLVSIEGKEGLDNTCNNLDLPTLERFARATNADQEVSFSPGFYQVFFASYDTDKFTLIGPKKCLRQGIFKQMAWGEEHYWNAMYLTKWDTEEDAEFARVLFELDDFCAQSYRAEGHTLEINSDEVRNILNFEGQYFKVKRSIGERRQNGYSDTPFRIKPDNILVWKGLQELIGDVQQNCLWRAFYELQPDRPMGTREVNTKFFGEGNIYEFPVLAEDCNICSRYSQELDLINIANKWMTKEYALNHFDECILEKGTKYTNAVFARMKKKPGLNGKTRSFWAEELNRILHHNYTARNLSSLSDDERFATRRGVNNGRSTDFFYLS